MAAPGFRANPLLYDELKIGGLLVPGDWDCQEIGRRLKTKTPKGDGDDGGTIRVTGLDISKGSITSQLNTDEEEAQWETLRAKIFPLDRPTQRNIQTIDHPQFARHGIRQILVDHVSEGRPKGGARLPVRIDWTLSSDKKGKTKKPGKPGAGANGGSIAQPTAFDPATGRPILQSQQLFSNFASFEQLQSLPVGQQVLMSQPR